MLATGTLAAESYWQVTESQSCLLRGTLLALVQQKRRALTTMFEREQIIKYNN